MTEADLTKLALDDVRVRQKALLDLILFQDQQAMGLLRLYVTLGIAAASGSLATIFSNEAWKSALGAGLLVAVAPLSLGTAYCFRATWAASIGFPGREPNFWQWASHPDIEEGGVREAYLAQLSDSMEVNHGLNAKCATLIKWAKLCGALTPAVTVFIGLVTYCVLTP
ncbi:hypothetical protein [Methylobacterium sp. GC_Met_2]|uniref:hypothetical protein n=1 Tax=Methylobacterium sp. GC_Met_2 TaxID=2937376 RepID=UPI00226BAD23|nr:hypothetical protein [Methylobacterium sp. GC_Met_2]